MASVLRSRGVSSGLPNLRVGSGHTGITAELDAEVERAAEFLNVQERIS